MKMKFLKKMLKTELEVFKSFNEFLSTLKIMSVKIKKFFKGRKTFLKV